MGMYEELVHAMSTAAAGNADRSGTQRRLVAGACDVLQSRPGDPPTLAEVCRLVHATPGELDRAFLRVLGIGVRRCVNAMRLAAVHRELARGLDPEATIYDTAARWGFWHFGHFSSDYRRHFDEWPWETLARCRPPGDPARPELPWPQSAH